VRCEAAIENLYDEMDKHRRKLDELEFEIKLLKCRKEDIKRTNRDRLGRFAKTHDNAAIMAILEGGAIDCFDKGLTHRRMGPSAWPPTPTRSEQALREDS
jgi:hypothetical protein